MKRFVFTNEKYYSIKQKDYDNLKREMENTEKSIAAVLVSIAQGEQKFEAEKEAQTEAFRKGVSALELKTYQWYFPYLREQLEKLNDDLQRLELEKHKLRQQLIRIHNEIKVLDEMREEQYAEYLREAALEEAKEMDSFMSFTIYEGAG